MDSMMDAIKSHNSIKIQQLFENEYVVLQSIPMTSYCSGFDTLSHILIPDDHANSIHANSTQNFILNTVSDWLNDKELTNGSFRYNF
jgi:hypothetical protein